VTADGTTKTPGCFTDKTHPAKAYDAAARRYHGQLAAMNFPD